MCTIIFHPYEDIGSRKVKPLHYGKLLKSLRGKSKETNPKNHNLISGLNQPFQSLMPICQKKSGVVSHKRTELDNKEHI